MSRPAEIAPSPHRFTREEYHRMGEAGLFANERVELLDGTIVTMSPQGCPHAGTVEHMDGLLRQATEGRFRVRAQLPVVLNDWSEPEPDLAVCVLEPHRYTRAHPLPEQIVLVCEIASSSLGYDRTEKAAAYAASGIPEYWIVDVDRRSIHVLREPDRDERRYRVDETVGEDGEVVAPGGARIAAADVLPPR